MYFKCYLYTIWIQLGYKTSGRKNSSTSLSYTTCTLLECVCFLLLYSQQHVANNLFFAVLYSFSNFSSFVDVAQ